MASLFITDAPGAQQQTRRRANRCESHRERDVTTPIKSSSPRPPVANERATPAQLCKVRTARRSAGDSARGAPRKGPSRSSLTLISDCRHFFFSAVFCFFFPFLSGGREPINRVISHHNGLPEHIMALVHGCQWLPLVAPARLDQGCGRVRGGGWGAVRGGGVSRGGRGGE